MINLYIFMGPNHSNANGIGTYVRELTISLEDSEISVCIVHLYSENTKKETVVLDGMRHIYIPSPINRNALLDSNMLRDLYYRNVVYLLRLQIKDTNKLVFHLNYNQSIKLAKELKKTFNCKIVTTIHYLYWYTPLAGNITRFKKVISKGQNANHENESSKQLFKSYKEEKDYFELVDHIICLSEDTRQLIHDDYQIRTNKTTLIYNGLADHPISNKSILRQHYHIPDIPIILFVGRLDFMKGLMYVIQAFKKVIDTKLHCQLIIAGNGTYDIYLKECENYWMNITWTGFVNKDKLYDLYTIADIGIMPSLSEQCSYVAIEMMMHSLPIIGSTSTGLKEMIVDGETGFKIPVMDYDNKMEIDINLLAEKILYFLQNKTEQQRMGQNALNRYKQLYSAEIFRQNMLSFYYKLK